MYTNVQNRFCFHLSAQQTEVIGHEVVQGAFSAAVEV
jgi:hypothetical protein